MVEMIRLTKEFQNIYAKWRDRIDLGGKEFCELEDKKRRELAALLRVAECCEYFPEGTIQLHETPDFLIKSREQKIGIELTDFVIPDIRREEKQWESILRKANAHYISLRSDTIPVVVRLKPTQAMLMKNIDVDALSESIAKYIDDNLPRVDDIPVSRRLRGIFNNTDLAIDMTVKRIRNPKRSSYVWSLEWFKWGSAKPESIQQHIQDQISNKNDKYNRYIQKCDEVWLIIFNEGNAFSTCINVPVEIKDMPFSSQFTKVLFCDFQNMCVYDLLLTGTA